MKKNSYLILSLLFIQIACTQAQPGSVKKVNAREFNQILASQEVQLVDVRTLREYQDGYIEGAILADISQRKSFEEFLLKLDKDKPVLVYCAVGGRSNTAANQMRTLGFSQIYDLGGGINAWKSSGLPLTKPE